MHCAPCYLDHGTNLWPISALHNEYTWKPTNQYNSSGSNKNDGPSMRTIMETRVYSGHQSYILGISHSKRKHIPIVLLQTHQRAINDLLYILHSLLMSYLRGFIYILPNTTASSYHNVGSNIRMLDWPTMLQLKSCGNSRHGKTF